ncbi:hypothetical protein K435DRAFT_783712 [Dendrothele bispora CBS 962.96]|uniref:Uncharacterized protein n=1 Tax=Dendrothele bispora (strain CBS 962.96) TaxID=1314807 RepID=A0A4S8L7B3_DENBC|nr:hypothetical protein K435DRAFT_783712 [Dendrothele bispora CBS 962.96]
MSSTVPSQPTEAASTLFRNFAHFDSWTVGVPVTTSYHGTFGINASQARDFSLLINSTGISRSYSISWIQEEMDRIDGRVKQAVEELMDHKAIIPGVWDMINGKMLLLQLQWKQVQPRSDLLTNCAVVEKGVEIVQELRRIENPCLQPAIDVLRAIIEHHAAGAYQSWIMERVENRTTFEDLPVSTPVDLTGFRTLILFSFGAISDALKTATQEQELRAPFDVLFSKIFKTYRTKTFIKTKYAPHCDNPTSEAMTGGFVIYPLGMQALSHEASVMIDWLKDASEDHTLGQLAVQYKHSNYAFLEVERQVTCDLVTASTVNLVLGVHMPVFGLAIHQDKAVAYICEAKPAPHEHWQSGRQNSCACTGMHHTASRFLDFGDLSNLSNYLRFVSFLIAYKKWYFDKVIQYIPSDNDNWIQQRALSAFRTYGPWRNEDRHDIDILRQSSRPDDSNDDGDDGAGVGSFDGGPNPDDELGLSRRHGFSHPSSSGVFRGGGGDALNDSSLVFVPDPFPMGPHLRSEVPDELMELVREMNRHARGMARANKRIIDYCFGIPNSLPGAHKE